MWCALPVIQSMSTLIALKKQGMTKRNLSAVRYPNHPWESHRKPCETVLLKKVQAKQGYVLVPIKVYPYEPLKKSIEQLVKRKGLLSKCEKWRTCSVSEGFLCDVYDGNVWDYFKSVEEGYFLNCPNSWLLTLNIDWFEPCECGVYSVGAIYKRIQIYLVICVISQTT